MNRRRVFAQRNANFSPCIHTQCASKSLSHGIIADTTQVKTDWQFWGLGYTRGDSKREIVINPPYRFGVIVVCCCVYTIDV